MDSMKFQSGQEYNWKHGMTENEVTEAVKEYKAKRKAEFEDKVFAELMDKAHVNKPIASFTDDYNIIDDYKLKNIMDDITKEAEKIAGASITLPEGIIKTCAHDWECHSSSQRVTPTGEIPKIISAEINRFENRVTKVFCRRCLEVKDI